MKIEEAKSQETTTEKPVISKEQKKTKAQIKKQTIDKFQ